eukprot:6224368-Pyramimonas_sp.AAC.2
MLKRLRTHAGQYGSMIHLGKTEILTNIVCTEAFASVGGSEVQIASPGESEKYLGRVVNLTVCHEATFTNRMASAWGSFAKFKDALCSKRCPLSAR